MSQDLIIRSVERVRGTTSSDFLVAFPTQIRATAIKLKYFRAANGIYTINSTNNHLPFNLSGYNGAVLIVGSYTSTTLMTEIARAMNVVSSGFVVSYSAVSLLVTISNPTPFILLFGSYPFNSCASILGFLPNQDVPITTSATGNSMLNLGVPDFIGIQIPELSTVRSITPKNGFTFIVPIVANSSEIIEYSSASQYEQVLTFPNMVQLLQFNIRLVDPSGQPLTINSEWFMVLEVIKG